MLPCQHSRAWGLATSVTHTHTHTIEGVCRSQGGVRVLTFRPFPLRVAKLPEPTVTRERPVIKNHSAQEINLTPSLPFPPPPATHSSSLHPMPFAPRALFFCGFLSS